MPTAEAAIDTPRAARYLAQFGKHARAMGGTRGHGMRMHGGNPLASGEVNLHVECADDQVVVTFDPWGSATLRVQDDRLTVRADAADEQNLHRIQEILTRDIERFGRRDQLTLTWDGTDPEPPAHRARAPIALTVAGVLGTAVAVAVHLGIGGVALALGGGVTVAAVVLLLAHVAIPVAALRIRRNFTHRGGHG
ncbi:DUF2218 domain-containing protein [Pseudonocardia sp. DSM 110487]|uniref:DUF2218 domain-containing protein n=1 Tax=Pseudonocardia sp. DSM 110487 TaxID=2865833 RepID=UPI001C6A2B4B|nr:DUF2218 domain-containing protein [Pseudonocardia sp. DSM 110487]QYN36491.1 DUF2218 domain-containing protein [Pseudonocardia sp. DSM 110487]